MPTVQATQPNTLFIEKKLNEGTNTHQLRQTEKLAPKKKSLQTKMSVLQHKNSTNNNQDNKSPLVPSYPTIEDWDYSNITEQKIRPQSQIHEDCRGP